MAGSEAILPAQPGVPTQASNGGTSSPPAASERRFGYILAALGLLGLLARLMILREYLTTSPFARVPVSDAQIYWDWAERIAHGQLLGDAPFFSAPLYPYLLGLLRFVGGALPSLYVVQMLADLVTAGLLAYVCRGRFGARAGLLAAALFLLLQEPAAFSLHVLASTLHLLLVTLTWATLVGVQARPTLLRLSGAGAALGLLCLSYAPATLLLPLVAVWVAWGLGGPRRSVWRAAVPVAAALAVIAPATLHNWRASGEFFLVQSGSGVALRQGNHPDSKGVYTVVPGISAKRALMHTDAARVVEAEVGGKPTWGQVDRFFRDQAIAFWRADPTRAARLALRKLYLFVSARHYGDIYQPSSEIDFGLSRWLRLAPVATPWLMGPALLGLAMTRKRLRHHAPEWMLLGLPLLVVAVFFYSPRYRAPAVPMIVVLAAWALAESRDWRRRRRRTVGVAAALLAGMLLGPVNAAIRFDLPEPSAIWFKLAHISYREGNVAESVAQLRAGLRIKPESAASRIALAGHLRELNRLDEALAEYERARMLAPNEPELLYGLSAVLVSQNRLAEAHELLADAVAKQPYEARLAAMLAEITQLQGQPEEARGLYQRALRLEAGDTTVRAAYANLLMEMQSWREALDQCAVILQSKPDHFDALHWAGVIHAQLGELEPAAASLERAVELRPRSVETWYDLGAVCHMAQQDARAAECFRRALVLDPSCDRCRTALEQLAPQAPSSPTSHP